MREVKTASLPSSRVKPTDSPHGGPTVARQDLTKRFAGRVKIDSVFTRKTVSYQGNRKAPGLRWMKYKEGFSATLVNYLLDEYKPKRVLDPFAGIGTTVLTAAGRGIKATGIEIMPVGTLVGSGIAAAANGLSMTALNKLSKALRKRITSARRADSEYAFPHVKITEAAFPVTTEHAISKAREFLAGMKEGAAKTMVNLACMSVLEAVSFTRKDGQYLRWDTRSGRVLRTKMDKGYIPSFSEELNTRLSEIKGDLTALKLIYGASQPTFMSGSSLTLLKDFPDAAFDMVITSPPYANRYDYTRTYALELAWLGLNQEGFSKLRQDMLSATVENKSKAGLLPDLYRNRPTRVRHAMSMYQGQEAIHEVLGILQRHVNELGNRHVIRLLEGYLLEMAVIVSELGRIVRPGRSRHYGQRQRAVSRRRSSSRFYPCGFC